MPEQLTPSRTFASTANKGGKKGVAKSGFYPNSNIPNGKTRLDLKKLLDEAAAEAETTPAISEDAAKKPVFYDDDDDIHSVLVDSDDGGIYNRKSEPLPDVSVHLQDSGTNLLGSDSDLVLKPVENTPKPVTAYDDGESVLDCQPPENAEGCAIIRTNSHDDSFTFDDATLGVHDETPRISASANVSQSSMATASLKSAKIMPAEPPQPSLNLLRVTKGKVKKSGSTMALYKW